MNFKRTNEQRLFKDKRGLARAQSLDNARVTVTVSEYGRFQLKCAKLRGNFLARAFSKSASHARGVIEEATGETEDMAIAALCRVIDARETRRRELRRVDTLTGAAIPTTEEYIEAMNCVELSGPQRAILLAMSGAGDSGLSEPDIAAAAGYQTVATALKALTNAGKRIGEFLAVEPSTNSSTNELSWTSLLAFPERECGVAEPRYWTLHEEARSAVESARP
jgi:hypothetical protein